MQVSQIAELSQFRRYWATQLIVPEVQVPQIRQLAEFHGNEAAQVIARKVQVLQIRQLAEFGRYWAAQSTVRKVQVLQIRHVKDRGKIRDPVAVHVSVLGVPRSGTEIQTGQSRGVLQPFETLDSRVRRIQDLTLG